MDSGNLLIKNTFIQIPEEDADLTAGEMLPRAFSDQSHARRQFVPHASAAPTFAGIPEHSEESTFDKSDSIQRLDSDELERLRTISRPSVDTRVFMAPQPPLMTMLNLSPLPAMPPVTPQVALPPIGDHRWHEESSTMGHLSAGRKEFTKVEFDGRLSMVTESLVHRSGIVRYLVLIVSGPVSVADGFGFVFASSLPCKKNIQKIDSVFLNQKGRLCSRTGNELEMHNTSSIGYIEVGSIVEITINMDSLEAIFSLYSPPKGLDAETLSILVRDDRTFSNWLVGSAALSMGPIISKTDHAKLPSGHFCAVIKNKNTTVRFL